MLAQVQRIWWRVQAELEAAQVSTSTPACSEVGSNGTPAPRSPPAEVEPQGSAAAAAPLPPNAFAALADGRTPPASPARRLVRPPSPALLSSYDCVWVRVHRRPIYRPLSCPPQSNLSVWTVMQVAMEARTPLSAQTERRLARIRTEMVHADAALDSTNLAAGCLPPPSPARAHFAAPQSPVVPRIGVSRALATLRTENSAEHRARGGATGAGKPQRALGGSALRATDSDAASVLPIARQQAAAGGVSAGNASAAVQTAYGKQTGVPAASPTEKRRQSQIPR